MADKIVVLREGVIEQVGSPVELYARPANQFVAGFLGAPQMNFLPALVAEGEGLNLAIDGNRAVMALSGRSRALASGAAAPLGVRPEHLVPSPPGPLAAKVETMEVLGAETILHARLASDIPVTVSVRGISGAAAGQTIRLALDDKFVHVFDADGQSLPPARAW